MFHMPFWIMWRKKYFLNFLDDLVHTILTDQILYIGSDFNNHNKAHSEGYVSTHGNFEYGISNDGVCTTNTVVRDEIL